MVRGLLITLMSAVLLLAACSGEKQEPEYERTQIELHVHLFDTERELNDHVNKSYKVSPATRSGFAKWWKPDPKNECHVYLVRGLKAQERNYGHELQHCIYGSFHKE